MKHPIALRRTGIAALILGIISSAGVAVAQTSGGLPATNLRVDGVEARVNTLETQQAATTATVNALGAQVGTLELQQATTAGTVQAHGQRLDGHDAHLADHNMRLLVIETPTAVTVTVGGYAAGNAATVNSGPAATARTDRWQTNSPGATNIHRLNPKEVKIQQNGSVNFVISGLHPLGVYPACASETDVTSTDCVSPAKLLAVSNIDPATGGDPANVANLFKIGGVVRNPATIDYDPNGLRLYRGLDNQILSLVGVSGAQGSQVAGTITIPEPAGTATTVAVTIPTVGLRERTEAVFFPNPGRYLVVCMLRSHLADGMYGYINVVAPAN
jgi:hypothetical protein